MRRCTFLTVAVALACGPQLEAQPKGMCDVVTKERVSQIIGAPVTMVSDSPPGGDIHATGVRRQCIYMVMVKGIFDPKHQAVVSIAPTYPNMTPELFKTQYATGAGESGFVDILGTPAFFSMSQFNSVLSIRLLVPGNKEELIATISNAEKYDTGYKVFKDPLMKDGLVEIARSFVKNLSAQTQAK